MIPLSVPSDLQKHHECSAPALVARGRPELRDHFSSLSPQPRCDGSPQYGPFSRVNPLACDNQDRPLSPAVCSRDKLFEAFECLVFYISVEVELARYDDRSPLQLTYPAACRSAPSIIPVGLRQFIAERCADSLHGLKKELLFVPVYTPRFFGGYAFLRLRLNPERRVDRSRPVNLAQKQGNIVVSLFFPRRRCSLLFLTGIGCGLKPFEGLEGIVVEVDEVSFLGFLFFHKQM